MMYDIISIGSATVDVFLKAAEFPLKPADIGRKIEVESMIFASGGGGTNTAAGFARLGLKTACIARFGDDLFGKVLLWDLGKEEFDKKYLLQKEGDHTDCSMILVNPNGSQVILIYRGRTKVAEGIFPWQVLEETKWLYLASLEGNVDLLGKVVEKACEGGVKVVLNPGSRELKEREKLLAIFPKLKALILNREEAEDFGLTDGNSNAPEIVVVTNGRQGAKLFSKKVNLFTEALIGRTVNETGAGDAFSSGFVAGLVKGFSLEKSLKLGIINSASVVSKIGAKSGLLYEKEINEWLGQRIKIEQIN